MGWGSGSYLMRDLIGVIKEEVSNYDARVRLYEGVISALEHQDWDTQGECLSEDQAYDEALMNLHSDWDWDWYFEEREHA